MSAESVALRQVIYVSEINNLVIGTLQPLCKSISANIDLASSTVYLLFLILPQNAARAEKALDQIHSKVVSNARTKQICGLLKTDGMPGDPICREIIAEPDGDARKRCTHFPLAYVFKHLKVDNNFVKTFTEDGHLNISANDTSTGRVILTANTTAGSRAIYALSLREIVLDREAKEKPTFPWQNPDDE